MEIPFTSKPRPDTGLYNAKVGVWLFLASEVMLFGALFSSYVLLRVGSDPGAWPQGLLNIPIGTANTAVLILSSVTVVMSWVALKLNQFGKFRLFMGITIGCALFFLGVKSLEYKEKFKHYQVWLNDGRTYVGHLEGDPYFWKTATLDEKGLDEITMHLDSPQPNYVAVTQPEGAHGGADAHGSGADASGDHADAEAAHEHPEMTFARDEIRRLSSFVPAHSTYFGIYFTLTALHGLHVFCGALVLAFFWGPGVRLWRKDPERFTNRIEVGGLFWHFVDLVWIFLFPILYLL